MIADTIARTANRHGYDPLFVQAMVEVESTCRPTARSRAGALGLIQLKPSTARAVARRVGMAWDGPQQLMVPAINLELGLGYLSELEEKFADPYLAVAAYNLGPTRVAGMDPSSARGSRYVRKILNRYEGLLRESGLTRS
jgi:soluble lytic murein transglycosylase